MKAEVVEIIQRSVYIEPSIYHLSPSPIPEIPLAKRYARVPDRKKFLSHKSNGSKHVYKRPQIKQFSPLDNEIPKRNFSSAPICITPVNVGINTTTKQASNV